MLDTIYLVDSYRRDSQCGQEVKELWCPHDVEQKGILCVLIEYEKGGIFPICLPQQEVR